MKHQTTPTLPPADSFIFAGLLLLVLILVCDKASPSLSNPAQPPVKRELRTDNRPWTFALLLN